MATIQTIGGSTIVTFTSVAKLSGPTGKDASLPSSATCRTYSSSALPTSCVEGTKLVSSMAPTPATETLGQVRSVIESISAPLDGSGDSAAGAKTIGHRPSLSSPILSYNITTKPVLPSVASTRTRKIKTPKLYDLWFILQDSLMLNDRNRELFYMETCSLVLSVCKQAFTW